MSVIFQNHVLEMKVPMDFWEHVIVKFCDIQTFSRFIRVCKEFHCLGIGDRRARILETMAITEMREQAANGCFYPSRFKQNCTPELMKKFAASDDAKGIFYVATRACPDLREEFVDAVQSILLLPNMECVCCYQAQTTMMEVVKRVGEKKKLTTSRGNMGVLMFL